MAEVVNKTLEGTNIKEKKGVKPKEQKLVDPPKATPRETKYMVMELAQDAFNLTNSEKKTLFNQWQKTSGANSLHRLSIHDCFVTPNKKVFLEHFQKFLETIKFRNTEINKRVNKKSYKHYFYEKR